MKNPAIHRAALIAFWGFIIFIMLYLAAAWVYPGGSEMDPTSPSFSFAHNYWCDLLQRRAENGMPNHARVIAISAMVILCASIVVFWWALPVLFQTGSPVKMLVRISGMLSMLILAFLRGNTHDEVINGSVALGSITMLFTFYSLYRSGMRAYAWFGIICLLLSLLNGYIYYSGQWFNYLALVQKITFISFLTWFSLLSLKIYNARH